MSPSTHPYVPLKLPTSETPEAILAVSRPIDQTIDGAMRAVGVAAIVRGDEETTRYWMAGYAASDDMARCAMIQHLLSLVAPDTLPQLLVWSPNIDTLQHVPGARLRGGMRSGKNKKKPFAAYSLFDPVEVAMRAGRWFLQTFEKDEEPTGYDDARRLAEKTLWVARRRAIEFPVFRPDHPDWHMLEHGTSDNPATERNGRP